MPRTTWYLQKDKLEPHEADELARRIDEEVRRLCADVLGRRFPKLQRGTRPTDVATTIVMRMLSAWKGFNDHKHFTNTVFVYASHILTDMTRRLTTEKGQQLLREESLESRQAQLGDEPRSEEEDVLDGILHCEERQWFEDCFADMKRDHLDLAAALALKLARFTERELAASLGITRHEVRMRLQRAIDFLTNRIPPDWLDN